MTEVKYVRVTVVERDSEPEMAHEKVDEVFASKLYEGEGPVLQYNKPVRSVGVRGQYREATNVAPTNQGSSSTRTHHHLREVLCCTVVPSAAVRCKQLTKDLGDGSGVHRLDNLRRSACRTHHGRSDE